MSEAVELVAKPWEAPFWKPVKGKEAILLYLVAVHVLAIVGLVLFPIPSLPVFAVFFIATIAGGFGTTVCYHRALSHRTLKLNPVAEHFLTFCAMFNGSGAPISWTAYHRRHHARADTLEDVSSPSHGGFWWAHLRWLYQTPRADARRWCPDLDRPAYRIWAYVEVPVILVAMFAGLLWSWEAFFWLGALRLVYSLHLQCAVNSVMHMGPTAENGDTSQNIWWLGPLQLAAWGENWHGNHHANANSARFGLRWWQVDIGWYAIWILEKVGLARGVKRPVGGRRLALGKSEIRPAA